MCEFEVGLNKFFNLRSNLSKPGLKTSMDFRVHSLKLHFLVRNRVRI